MIIGSARFEPECPRPETSIGDRAGNGARTRDLNLGKVALYQLSYSRIANEIYGELSSTVDRQAGHLFEIRVLQYTKNAKTVQGIFSCLFGIFIIWLEACAF